MNNINPRNLTINIPYPGGITVLAPDQLGNRSQYFELSSPHGNAILNFDAKKSLSDNSQNFIADNIIDNRVDFYPNNISSNNIDVDKLNYYYQIHTENANMMCGIRPNAQPNDDKLQIFVQKNTSNQPSFLVIDSHVKKFGNWGQNDEIYGELYRINLDDNLGKEINFIGDMSIFTTLI